MLRGAWKLLAMISAAWGIIILAAGFALADEADGKKASESDHSVTAEIGGRGEGDDGHGDDHDPFDLGHQNATADLEDVMSFKTDLAIWSFVIFFCLLALLGKFAWGPITAGLDQREASIAAMIDEANQRNEAAAAQLKEYEAQLAAAGEEARGIVIQARQDAEAACERVRDEAQQDAERQRQRAVEDIANAKNSALQEMTERSVDLATSMAGRMLQRQLNSEDQSELIREALEQLPSRN